VEVTNHRVRRKLAAVNTAYGQPYQGFDSFPVRQIYEINGLAGSISGGSHRQVAMGVNPCDWLRASKPKRRLVSYGANSVAS